MSPPPLLSIITVAKDDRAGFARTQASLTMQSYTGFEWLIADGGSQDGTAEDALAALRNGHAAWADSRADDGPYAGMNRALPVARGGYVLFLNAGDCLVDNEVLRRLAETVAKRPAPDILLGDALERSATGLLRRKRARPPAWIIYGMPTHHCAILYSRAALAGRRFPESLSIAADYALTAGLIAGGATVTRCGFPIAAFAPGGLSQVQAAAGRRQQRGVRRGTLKVNPVLGAIVEAGQSCAAKLRIALPRIYDTLRYDGRDEEPKARDQEASCSSSRHGVRWHNPAP